jgi:predicted nucleic acid-binding protein
MAILVDASVWIAYFNGVRRPETDFLDHALGKLQLAVPDLALAEVTQGMADERDWKAAEAALLKFPIYSVVDRDIALQSAMHYRVLRAKGLAVPRTLHLLIATFCLRWSWPLLHCDAAFEPLREHLGVPVVDPEE